MCESGKPCDDLKHLINEIKETIKEVATSPISEETREKIDKARNGDPESFDYLVLLLKSAAPIMKVLMNIPPGSAAVFTKRDMGNDTFTFDTAVLGSTDGDPLREIMELLDKIPGVNTTKEMVSTSEEAATFVDVMFRKTKPTVH